MATALRAAVGYGRLVMRARDPRRLGTCPERRVADVVDLQRTAPDGGPIDGCTGADPSAGESGGPAADKTPYRAPDIRRTALVSPAVFGTGVDGWRQCGLDDHRPGSRAGGQRRCTTLEPGP